MAFPPLLVGALHETWTEPAVPPYVAVTDVGALGTRAGVAVTEPDTTLVPIAFIAETRT